MFIYLLILIHLFLIAWVYHDYRQQKLRLDPFLIIFLLLFPIVGFLGLRLIQDVKTKAEKRKEVSFDEVMPWLVEEKMAPIGQNSFVGHTDIRQLVPFQEALLINNPRVRRYLLVDVIFHHPERYVKLLHQARLNDDVEVVHYATTILSELTKAYDEEFYKINAMSDMDTSAAMDAQLDFLYRYLKSGLAEGVYALQLRRRFEELSKEKLLLKERNLKDFTRLGEVYVAMRAEVELEDLTKTMLEEFPLEQETWMMKLEHAILASSPRELQEVLKVAGNQRIFFSQKNREKLAFWQEYLAN